MDNILKYQNPSSPLLIQKVNQSGVNFVKRLLDPNRKSIPDWETKGQKIATHKMSWGEDEHGAYVFPEVQEIDEQLIDFSRPPYAPGIADYMAHKNNNIIRMSPEEADWFTRNYKQYYPSFKKGGRIHIKKKNRGKFTDYCGGKVTEECIAKGKKSKDPKIRKRATFAANARKWKHENGGILKYQNPAIPLDLPEGSEYGGELEPAIVKPTPIKAELNTYYPVVSKYPWTGHSELILHNTGPQKSSVIITRGGYNSDYNLITNNCSDSTRCAVEQIYNEKINPILFTTPGDVRDFLLKKGIDKIKTGNGVESQYFEIPFATAMELRNKNIDYQIQDYLKKAEDHKKDMEKLAKSHNRKWNSSGYDESTAKVVQELEKRKYKFQPFKNKNGGILKAQDGTGNLYAPHPLSPVGIALNQAKAMAKGKTHFPPGVKEVVGPDGKKVAIRTEQPLVPLEQSIAEWLPGTGDVTEVGYIANDVKNGNYGSAALAAAMVALPGNVGKVLSKHRKAVSKTADAVEDAVRKADVSEYINTVDDALPERQPLTTNKSKQFWDGTSESKLTDAEKQGVPKGERNQPINVRTPSQEFSNKYISSKMVLRKPTYDYEDLTENYFRDVSADEFNKRLKEYVSYARHKGSPITNEIAEPIVKGYRNYLHHLDFDAKDLSDDELRIILSKHFADLSRGASGKMKDQIVWHSSPTWFDEFDYRYTGKNMENSGAMGPGNYFSKEATMYGRGKKGEFSGKYDMGNTQPYIITDVISTPSGKDMQNKGLLPTIIHKYRGRDIYGHKWNPDPEFDIKLKAQIDAVPLNDNKMYVLEGTDSGFDKLYQTPFGLPGGELMIRRNTGIKSLYPHPSRFVRDADGFVHLIPVDWNDARVNFKKGGKL